MIPVLFYAADIFSFAHHAWASETASVSSAGGESGEAEADISWFRSELARLRFDLQGKLTLFSVQGSVPDPRVFGPPRIHTHMDPEHWFRVSSPYFVFWVISP